MTEKGEKNATVGSGMVCSLLMLTRSRAAPDWSESLSVMTEGAWTEGGTATGRGALYIYIYIPIYLKAKAEILLINADLK